MVLRLKKCSTASYSLYAYLKKRKAATTEIRTRCFSKKTCSLEIIYSVHMFYCHLLKSGNEKVKKQKARSNEEVRKTRVATIMVARSPRLHFFCKKIKRERKRENTKHHTRHRIFSVDCKTALLATVEKEGKGL